MAFRFQVLNSCICSVLLIQKQRNVYLSFFVYFRLEWEFCLSLTFALLTKCSSFISILESTFLCGLCYLDGEAYLPVWCIEFKLFLGDVLFSFQALTTLHLFSDDRPQE